MSVRRSRKPSADHSAQVALHEWEGQLKALFEQGTSQGVPPEIIEALLPHIQEKQKAAPPALLWALGVECRSPHEPRLFLESVGRWIQRIRAIKGIKVKDVQLLVGAVQELQDQESRWRTGLAWLALSPIPSLAKIAWQAILNLGLQGVVGQLLRSSLVDPKTKPLLSKLFDQELKQWARVREVRRDSSSVAELLIGLEGEPSSDQMAPGWLTSLLCFKDVLWVSRLLAALTLSGGTVWREALFRWLAASDAFGPTLQFLRHLSRSEVPPTEEELRRLLQGRPSDRGFLLLRELLRESERGKTSVLITTLARLAAQSAVPLNDQQRLTLAEEIQRVTASPSYDQDVRRAILETLASALGVIGLVPEVSTPVLLGLASDLGVPPDRREEAAIRLIEADPGQYLQVARAVADLPTLAGSPLLDQLYTLTVAEVQRSTHIQPFLQVMLALRSNAKALGIFGERCAQMAYLPAITDALIEDWSTQGTLHSKELLTPEELRPVTPLREFIVKELARRAMAAHGPEDGSIYLAWLIRLEPGPERVAGIIAEVSHERTHQLEERLQSRLEATTRRFEEEQAALRAAHRREQEQQLADLLSPASAVWAASQEIGAGADKEFWHPLSEAWAYLVEFFAKHGYRPFPERLKVPFDPALHEYRGDASPPPPGSLVRVARLGLERAAAGSWVRVQKAIVVSVSGRASGE